MNEVTASNKPELFDVVVQHLVYAMKDVNISLALNEKTAIIKNEAAVSTLTEVLEQSGHTVVINKNKKGYIRLSIDGQKQSI